MGTLRPSMLKPDLSLSLTLSPSNSPHGTIKPEERGIKLIKLLLECAKHASLGDLHRADSCLSEISELSSVTGDSMQRLSSRFASALAMRLMKSWTGLYKSLNHIHRPKMDQDQARAIFAQTSPCIGLAYSLTVRTLIRTMTHDRIIHIVDLGSGDPKLWVQVLHGFAQFPHGPAHVRVTCVNSNKASLEKLGQRLFKEAETLDMPFQFNPVNIALKELNVNMLKIRPGEALAFVSMLSLHALLAEDDRVDALLGAYNTNLHGAKDCKQMCDFLAMVRSVSPKLFFVVEQEADHNSNKLMDRFVEGLHYYSAIFDSIDATLGGLASEERLILEEMFCGEIENIVACEGLERIERHEKCGKWAVRLGRTGFRPIRLWYDPNDDSKQIVGNDGFKIVGDRTSLMICWHERPLYALTAWTS